MTHLFHPLAGRDLEFVAHLWVPKTCANWADALRDAVGSVMRTASAGPGLGSAGGGMIFGLWA